MNFVSAGVVGATIGGGGVANLSGYPYTNSVTANFGTVGGGYGNIVGGTGSTVGGGFVNTAGGVSYNTVSGGTDNSATGRFSTGNPL